MSIWGNFLSLPCYSIVKTEVELRFVTLVATEGQGWFGERSALAYVLCPYNV